jgi:hypothetical protein
MSLVLEHLRRSSEDSPDSEWMIATQDGGDAEFPSDECLQALFKEHVPTDELVVVKNRENNRIVVKTPPNLPFAKNANLLYAVWRGTRFP